MDVQMVFAWLEGLGVYLLFFLLVVALDLASGVVRSLLSGHFSFEKLPNFLLTALGYLLAWGIAEVLGFLPSVVGLEIKGYQDAIAQIAPKVVYGAVLLKYVSSMVKVVGYFQSVEKPDV